MNRMMAIIEREMRKFFRSPTLMLVAMIFPLVQLIILKRLRWKNSRSQALSWMKTAERNRCGFAKPSIPCRQISGRLNRSIITMKSRQRTTCAMGKSGRMLFLRNIRAGFMKGPAADCLLVDNSGNFIAATVEGELTDITASLNNPRCS